MIDWHILIHPLPRLKYRNARQNIIWNIWDQTILSIHVSKVRKEDSLIVVYRAIVRLYNPQEGQGQRQAVGDGVKKPIDLASNEYLEWSQDQACCSCSVAKSCPALCDPMECSTPGFPVPHHSRWRRTHIHIPSSPCPLDRMLHSALSCCILLFLTLFQLNFALLKNYLFITIFRSKILLRYSDI